MTESRTRMIAAVATALGFIAGGFEAHLAPQTDGWWHGLTGSPSFTRIACAMGAAVLVWFLGRVTSSRPFLWMGAGLLPLIPALSGFGAPLLFFSGFTMVLVFAILLGYAMRDLPMRLPSLHTGAVVLVAFAFFVLVGRFLPGPAGPQGDEPHYLLIAESLLKDGDVDLQNQFDTRAFSKFTAANLDPHTAPRSPKGRMYAIHTPGLSALVAPGYAAAGYAGARVVLSAMLALAVGLLFIASGAMFGPPTASFVFLLATFASPLPIYANALYPDSAATLAVAATLACLTVSRKGLIGLAAGAIALLPWLHPRFVPLAFLLALSISIRDGFSARRFGAVLLPLLVSLGLLLLHFHSLFGRASLSAAYGPGFSSDVSLFRVPWGASALVFDRQFGLLIFAPVLIVGSAGLIEIWKRHRLIAFVLAASIAGMLTTGGAFSMWWGGASAPARFLVSVMPALIFATGALWHSAEARSRRRRLLGAGAGFGAGLLLLACLAPRTLHNRADGESGLLRLLSPTLDMDRFFPGFVQSQTATLHSPKPLLDPFKATLRLLEAWNDDRRALGGTDDKAAFSLDIPLGEAPWNLTPGVRMYSPRFSLPEGEWWLSVESQAEPTPDALNVARISLVGDEESAPPFAAAQLKVGEGRTFATFRLERGQRRLHILGEGLQSRTTVIRVRLTPGARLNR